MDGDNRAVRLIEEGMAYHWEKNYKIALEYYSRSIGLDPTSASAFYNRSLVYVSLGEYEKAEQDRFQAVRLDPSISAVWRNQAVAAADAFVSLGNAKYGDGNNADALKFYREAIKLLPSHAAAYVGCGTVHFESGEAVKAEKCYDMAIVLEPNNIDALYNRALVLGARLEYGRAIEDLTKLLAINPRESEAYLLRAEYFEACGRHEEALADRRAHLEFS